MAVVATGGGTDRGGGDGIDDEECDEDSAGVDLLFIYQRNLLESAILPSIADAAAVAGDARYTFDERAPILPTKFLEDDEMQISFSPNAPR